MKKILFLLVLAALLVSGCSKPTEQTPGPNQNTLQDQNTPDQNTVPQEPPLTPEEQLKQLIDGCKALATTEEKDNCIQELALEKQDKSICLELEKFSPDFCIKEIALTTQNEQACAEVSQAVFKNDCYNSIGLEKNDSAICDKIEGNEELKNQCKKTVLLNSPDFSCDKLSDRKEKDDCFTEEATVQNNPFLCESVSGTFTNGVYKRDNCLTRTISDYSNPGACGFFISKSVEADCFLQTAENLLDEELCKKTEPQEKVDECIDFVAKEKGSLETCYLISTDDGKKACVNYLAENTPTAGLCDLATLYSSKDKCNHAIGIQESDASFCAKISTGELKDDCFYKVALANNDAESCKKIYLIEYDLKDSCFIEIALALLEEPICENVNFDDNYVLCFSGIAVKTNDIKTCDKMARHNLISYDYAPEFECYKNYAIETSQPSVCDLITPPAPKQACIDGISG